MEKGGRVKEAEAEKLRAGRVGGEMEEGPIVTRGWL